MFEGLAFTRPLFYSYAGGLRFELSESGTSIEQFLLALNKATTICADVFPDETQITVCLRRSAEPNQHSLRDVLRELRSAGIIIPRTRQIWLAPKPLEEWFDEAIKEQWLNVAFELPKSALQNLLWCAFATDFGTIRPNPHCAIYLFNLNQRVMVWPYDDRGMDVVGPNKNLLSALYKKHNQFLLDFDRNTMNATFETSSHQVR
ncbi:MAG: DUF3885 domain-containing protein [Pseudomonadota bacterium]